VTETVYNGPNWAGSFPAFHLRIEAYTVSEAFSSVSILQDKGLAGNPIGGEHFLYIAYRFDSEKAEEKTINLSG
jgi:hypothetical protein